VIWFSSDWHLFHNNVIHLSKRPFRNNGEMHEAIVSRMLAVCRPGDTLVLVGDITFGNTEQTRAVLNALRKAGVRLVIVRGNHDPDTMQLYNMGFDLVVDRMEFRIRGRRVVVHHFPFRPSLWKQLRQMLKGIRLKYMRRRMKDDGETFLIHGHTHSNRRLEGRALHVGVDAWDFKPVSLRQIESHIDRLKKEEKGEHTDAGKGGERQVRVRRPRGQHRGQAARGAVDSGAVVGR
jgi:calcineurin-like phosphoesterase family protein